MYIDGDSSLIRMWSWPKVPNITWTLSVQVEGFLFADWKFLAMTTKIRGSRQPRNQCDADSEKQGDPAGDDNES